MTSTDSPAAALFPLFLKLDGRKVLVVGGGPVATAKVRALLEAQADVHLVAPDVTPELVALSSAGKISLARRSYEARDLDGIWLVVVAAPLEVARIVAEAAESQRRFVLAVDQTSAASAYGAGTLRRGGVTIAVSTDGRAPALAGLIREGLEAVLPDELADWTAEAERQRAAWKAESVPMAARRPRLLGALNDLYGRSEPPAMPSVEPTSTSRDAKRRRS